MRGIIIVNTTAYTLAQAIKKVRQSKGWRQRELAKACGTGTRFIVDIEKGKKTCQVEKVLNALHVLGITVELHHKVK